LTRKRRRLLALVLGLGLLGAATAMVLAAFNDNLVFFYGPSDLAAKAIPPGRRIRIGGLVEQHSLRRETDGHSVDFRVTDGKTVIAVVYDGVLLPKAACAETASLSRPASSPSTMKNTCRPKSPMR
jgi:cytochrome c-type biogenesis protein CcmE